MVFCTLCQQLLTEDQCQVTGVSLCLVSYAISAFIIGFFNIKRVNAKKLFWLCALLRWKKRRRESKYYQRITENTCSMGKRRWKNFHEKETKEQMSIKIQCSTKCLTASNHKQCANLSSTHAATKTSPWNVTWLPCNCWKCCKPDTQMWMQISTTDIHHRYLRSFNRFNQQP
jgi:hypothetical protein